MSDRIAVMNHGVIEQVDEPESIYERPRTTFVAGFIGVSNLMPGEVVSANGNGAEIRLDARRDRSHRVRGRAGWRASTRRRAPGEARALSRRRGGAHRQGERGGHHRKLAYTSALPRRSW